MFNETIVVRCDADVALEFKTWCISMNREYQDVIRELIEAAPKGRVNIKPTQEQLKNIKELYKS